MAKIENKFVNNLAKIVEIDVKQGYEWDQFVVEEVGELLSAIAKYKRGRNDWPSVLEESADVILTIYAMMFRTGGPNGIYDMEEIISKKIDRTIAREGGVLNGEKR